MYQDSTPQQQRTVRELMRCYTNFSRGQQDQFNFSTDDFERLAAFYFRCSRYEQALEVCKLGLSHHPYAAALYLQQVTSLLELYLYEQALTVLATAAVYAPESNPQILLLRARALSGLSRFDEAFKCLEALNGERNPELLSNCYSTEAIIFEQMGRNNDAYHFLEQAISVYAENKQAFELLWVMTELTGRHQDTITLCLRALRHCPYNAYAWYNLGHARRVMGKHTLALEALEYAYLIDPAFEFAYREAGELCLEKKLYERGIEVYETMMDYNRVGNDILLRLAICYYHAERYKQARLCLNRVLGSEPMDDEALYYSGRCYVVEGNWRAAANAFRRAVAANDQHENYQLALAEALVRVEQFRRAEHYYGKATRTAPEDPAVWQAYSEYLYRQHRYLDALAVLDEAEDHVYHSSLIYLRVLLLLALGREAAALRLLAEQLEDDAADHEILFRLNPALRQHSLIIQVIRCFT